MPDENIMNESESLRIGERNLKELASEIVYYNLSDMICWSESNDNIAGKCEQHIRKGIRPNIPQCGKRTLCAVINLLQSSGTRHGSRDSAKQ